jgi:hypothetical protein
MLNESFDPLIGEVCVFDTSGAIVYLGRLVAADDVVFTLENADVHDCRDGHATKEVYINDARLHGVSPNRERVLVFRSSVMSLSLLSDVVSFEE